MAYTAIAKRVAETMKKDPIIFQIWPEFVALRETLDQVRPKLHDEAEQITQLEASQGLDLLQEGKRWIAYIASARVPMPLGTKQYIAKCQQYQAPAVTVE